MHALRITLTELNNLHNTGRIKLLVGPMPKNFGAIISVCHCQADHFSSLNNLQFLPCFFFSHKIAF